MYKIFIAFIAIAIFTMSCKNKKTATQKPVETTTDTAKGFPIMDLLREDVEDVKKRLTIYTKKQLLVLGKNTKILSR